VYGWLVTQPAIFSIFKKTLSKLSARECKSLLWNLSRGFEAFERGDGRHEVVLLASCETQSASAPATMSADPLSAATASSNDLRKRLTEANERINNQEALLFQYEKMLDRMALALEKYRESLAV